MYQRHEVFLLRPEFVVVNFVRFANLSFIDLCSRLGMRIGVLGASGYTGAELVRLLLRHPSVEIVLLTAERRAGQEMRSVFPQFSPYLLPRLLAIASTDGRPHLSANARVMTLLETCIIWLSASWTVVVCASDGVSQACSTFWLSVTRAP